MSLLEHYDALLLDLDGTVWEGGRALPGAVETIRASHAVDVYITNNAMRGPAEVAQKLAAIGLDVPADRVITSAQAAVSMARQNFAEGTKVLVLGTDSFRQLAAEAGFRVTESADDQPEIVLQGLSHDIGWPELSEAALAIQRGAVFIASNLDTTLPMERGLMVGNGSMVAAVVSATGVAPAAAGKPQPTMFEQAVAAVGSQRPLAIGDRLDTDIQGANAAKIPTLHVLTGVSGHLALLEAPEEQRPQFLAEDMRDLHKQAEELLPGAQGGFTARWDQNDIILDNGTPGATATQALRTVAEVAWARGTAPDLVRPVSDAAEAATAQWR